MANTLWAIALLLPCRHALNQAYFCMSTGALSSRYLLWHSDTGPDMDACVPPAPFTIGQVRETMRIMGLRSWAHELSWLITGSAVFAFIAVSVAALLSLTFLPLADGSLLLVFMLSFTFSEVGMALLVASVFSKVFLSLEISRVYICAALGRGSGDSGRGIGRSLASIIAPSTLYRRLGVFHCMI